MEERDADAQLMLRYAAGDARAFEELYERNRAGLWRFIRHLVRDAAATDDVFQECWSRVIGNRERYRPTARFTTWLYRIAHNRLVDHWRTHARAEFVATDVDGDEPDPLAFVAGARGDEPEVRAGAREQGQRIDVALSRLPPAQREAFLLHQEGGLELADIAALTGAGIETVKSRLRYALAKLRLELADLR